MNYFLQGHNFYQQGNLSQAILNYANAVIANSRNDEYRQKLINVVSEASFTDIDLTLKEILTDCLESKTVEFLNFGHAWHSVIRSDTAIRKYYNISRQTTYETFKADIEQQKNLDGLIDPFFLTGLGQFVVADTVFEKWCGFLRRFLLESLMAERQLFTEAEDIEFITCALARYSFFVDYIWPVSEEEEKQAETLQLEIEQTDKPDLHKLAMLACYERISDLKNAQAIAVNLEGGEHVSQIPKSQIEDFYRQQDIKKDIEALTEIGAEISSAVRDQYEEFPYPRWNVYGKDIVDDDIERPLVGKVLKILNAGCGTGREAIQLAQAFPQSEVTAIDLSLTSLAYAKSKADAFGIKNVKFYQADISKLGSMAERFDYITSAGVLHHMEDPKAGWRVLQGLLKPDGLMRIGLYSRHARWAVNEARHAIEKSHIGSDAPDIRSFRQNIRDHLKEKAVKNLENTQDYYELSGCRDFLFHAQEHQFDLIEVQKILDELNLECLKFYLAEHHVEKYKKANPLDIKANNLESWAKWEEAHKDLFIGMYIFWCRGK